MHRQSGLGLEDADDAVAGHGRTAMTEMDADPRSQPAAAHEQPRLLVADPLAVRPGLQPPLQRREQGLADLGRRHAAAPDGLVQIVLGGEGEGLQHGLQRHFGQGLAGARQGLVQGGAAQLLELAAFRGPDVPADRRPRPARNGQRPPVDRNLALGAAHDLDHVAVLQLGPHRLQLAVDLDPHRRVADLGMDRIGEVQRHAAARQGDQRTLGREHEHLLEIHLQLGVLDPVLAALAVLDDLHQMPQVLQRIAPAVLLHGLLVEAIGLVLVGPVRRHPVLGDPVHRLGPDLHLDAQARRSDHGRVQGAVVVRLGRRDEVLEPLRHHRPGAVDHTEGAVAVVLGLDDDPEAVDVRQGREAHRLALQLAPDRIGRLLPAEHLGVHPGLFQHPLDLARDAVDGAAMLQLQRLQPPLDGGAGGRVQMLERQLFQLGGDRMDADRPAQRRIDLQRLAADPLALLGLHMLQRPHVVQTVGQLHQQDADVLGDGEDEFAQVLGLARVLGLELQPRQLGDPLDQRGDLLAEAFGDVVAGGRGVLNHVVQQGGDDGGGVEPVVGQDPRDLDGMGEIGIARGPQLRAVHLHRIDIGAVQQRLVRGGIIGAHGLHQFELAKHPRAGVGFRLHVRTRAAGVVQIGGCGRGRGLPRRQDGDTVGGIRRQ